MRQRHANVLLRTVRHANPTNAGHRCTHHFKYQRLPRRTIAHRFVGGDAAGANRIEEVRRTRGGGGDVVENPELARARCQQFVARVVVRLSLARRRGGALSQRQGGVAEGHAAGQSDKERFHDSMLHAGRYTSSAFMGCGPLWAARCRQILRNQWPHVACPPRS